MDNRRRINPKQIKNLKIKTTRPLTQNGQRFLMREVWNKIAEFLEEMTTTTEPQAEWKITVEMMLLQKKVINALVILDTPSPLENIQSSSTLAPSTGGLALYNRAHGFLKNYVGASALAKERRGNMTQKDEFELYATEYHAFFKIYKTLDVILHELNHSWIPKQRSNADHTKRDVLQICDLSHMLWKTKVFSKYGENVSNELQHRMIFGNEVEKHPARAVLQSYIKMGLDKYKYAEMAAKAGADFDDNGHLIIPPPPPPPQTMEERENNRLTIYRNNFETEFLRRTRLLYEATAIEVKAMFRNDPWEYVKAISGEVEALRTRTETYVHRLTVPRLIEVFRTNMIANEVDTINAAIPIVMPTYNPEDIHCLYTVVSKAGNESCQLMANAFEAEIKTRGHARIEAFFARDPVKLSSDGQLQLVDNLIDLYNNNVDYLIRSLENHNLFRRSVNEAMGYILNVEDPAMRRKGRPQAAVLCANCCHLMLDRKAKTSNILRGFRATRSWVEMCSLINLIEDKDKFLDRCRGFLYRRMLDLDNFNVEEEKQILLKFVGGDEFAMHNKFMSLFRDFQISRNITRHFRGLFNPLPYDMTACVFQEYKWPFPVVDNEWNIPEELAVGFQAITNLQDKELKWQPQEQFGELYFRPKNNNEEIIIESRFHSASVLLCFNDQNVNTMEELKAKTQLSDEELIQTLANLMKAKTTDGRTAQILLREGNTYTVNDDCITTERVIVTGKLRA